MLNLKKIEDLKIGILGGGAWGTTIANLMAKKSFDTTLWIHNKNTFEEIKNKKENTKYLPGIKLSNTLQFSNNLEGAMYNKDILIIAIPVQKIRELLVAAKKELIRNALILNLSKGLEIATNYRVSEILKEIFPEFDLENYGILSGPNFAEEVAREMPTATVIGGINENNIKLMQEILKTSYFRIYTNTDLVGIELGGAIKNVIAIAAGMSDGLGYGDSSKSALIIRGLQEMIKIVLLYGAKINTLNGLSGIGDLIATSFSKKSRNRWAGEEFGKGRNLKEVLSMTDKVIEGVYTVKALVKIGKFANIDLPVTNEVYSVIYENKEPLKALSSLMERKVKDEFL